jgi:hypothetical protein
MEKTLSTKKMTNTMKRFFKMFSKRHYEKIAQLIKNSDAKTKYELAQDLAKLFQADNPRFSFKRFAQAVGITTET